MEEKKIFTALSLSQVLYHATHCLMFSFASVYLLDRGFSNGHIGMTIGTAYGLSILLQHSIPTILLKSKIRMNHLISALYALAGGLSGFCFLFPIDGLLLSASLVLAFAIQAGLSPSVDSLYKGFSKKGLSMNFNIFRGIGSGAFGCASLIMGLLLKRYPPRILPLVYGCTAICLSLLVLFLKAPDVISKSSSDIGESILKRSPRFALLLVGAALLFLAASFVDNFLMQIMMNVGGNSNSLGIALSLAAFVEMPVMLFYGKARKYINSKAFLIISAWVWFIKNLLLCIAKSPAGIYCSQGLQIFSYAIYIVAIVDYITHYLPESDFLQAQAFAGIAKTIGSLSATVLGGHLIDLYEVSNAVRIMLIITFIGAVCLTFSVNNSNSV